MRRSWTERPVRPSRLILHVLAITTGMAGAAFSQAPDLRQSSRKELSNLVCGPRCVKFVIEQYGRDAGELHQVVRQIQWPNYEDGATVQDLERTLNENGVYTRSVKISPESALDWPHPVIVHLTPPGERLGHYVVLLPKTAEGAAVVWNGLIGYEKMRTWELAAQADAVILTSPNPIEASQTPFHLNEDTFYYKINLLFLGVFAIATGVRTFCR